MGNEDLGCSGIFAHTQLIYSPVFFMFMVFKFCLPIWSLLIVLEPLPGGIPYSEIIATSHCGVCVSILLWERERERDQRDLIYLFLYRAYLELVQDTPPDHLTGSCVATSSTTTPRSWADRRVPAVRVLRRLIRKVQISPVSCSLPMEDVLP